MNYELMIDYMVHSMSNSYSGQMGARFLRDRSPLVFYTTASTMLDGPMSSRNNGSPTNTSVQLNAHYMLVSIVILLPSLFPHELQRRPTTILLLFCPLPCSCRKSLPSCALLCPGFKPLTPSSLNLAKDRATNTIYFCLCHRCCRNCDHHIKCGMRVR